MSSEVKLPRLGQGMEAGTIVKWLKAEGDRVEKGEPLFEVDTDKATQEVEAEASGVLLKIAVDAGEVPVGTTIAVIGEEGEAASVEAPAEPDPEPEPADMTLASDLVERARELNPDVRITVTDLLTKISAMALMRHRDVNVQFTEEALLKFPTANIGIAVAAPTGLVVPVIRQAERL